MSFPIYPPFNTANGANWDVRFYANFLDDQGRGWRVEFIDAEENGHGDFGLAAGEISEAELTSDGFVLSYDGPTDHIGGSIIPSSLQVTWVVDTAKMALLHNAIMDANDERFAMAVYMDDGSNRWQPYWVGTLNHEAIEWETQDEPYLLTLTASCGLNRLRQIKFENANDSALKGRYSLAEYAAVCLNKIPTINFWVSDEIQMSEVVDVYHEEHVNNGPTWTQQDGAEFPFSVMERTFVDASAFTKFEYSGEDEFGRRAWLPPKFSSCFDVLESITNVLQCRLFLADFSFQFIPVNAYNWSHTLQVNEWPRSIVAAGDISTVLDVDEYVDRATHTSRNFRYDIESQHALGLGWTNSFLLPVKRAAITHTNAGQRSVVPLTYFYPDWPNAGGITFPNDDIDLLPGDTLNVRGHYYTGQLIKEFGSTLTNAAYNDHGFKRIGARIILRIKIEVDGWYYVSQYTTGDTVQIDMPSGYQPDGSYNISNPQWGGYELTVPDAQWTQSEGWFDLIIPWSSSNPAATVLDHSNGETYLGGLHLGTHPTEDRFEYDVSTTQQDTVDHPFNIMTAPLPDDVSSYSGVEITVDRIVVGHGGQVYQTFTDLADIFTQIAAVQYDHNGNDISPSYQDAPDDYVLDFFVGVGSDSNDSDFTYFADGDENTEILDLGETPLNSSTLPNQPSSDGTVYHFGYQYATYPNFSLDWDTDGWHSITDTIDQDQDSTNLITVGCREQFFMRRKPLPTQRGDIIPKPMTGQTGWPISMTNVIHHNCSTTNDVEDYLVPMTLSFVAGTGITTVEAVRIARAANNTWTGGHPDDPTGPGPANPGGMIGGGQGSTQDPGTQLTNRINNRVSVVNDDLNTVTTTVNGHTVSIANVANRVDTVENKTDNITVTNGKISFIDVGSNTDVIDAEAVTTDQDHQWMSVAEKAQHLDNTECSSRIGRSPTTGHIVSFTVDSGSKPLTADQVNDSGSTNKFTTAANNTKLGYISVSQAVDLDEMESNLDEAYDALNLDNPADRTGQVGVEVATINSSGVITSISDGSDGQFLKTNGSGSLTWAKTQSGWHGFGTKIKVMPHEWVMNDDYNRAPIMVEDDTTGTLGIVMPSNVTEAYAMITIPDGFDATHVQVFASANTASAVTVYSYNHTTGAIVSKGTGAFNSNIDITDVSASATQGLCVKIAPASPTTLIYGATITIA